MRAQTSKIGRVFLIVVAAYGLAAPVARAEDTFEALGSAPIVGGNTNAAQERALQEAFVQAVDQAVATLVSPTERAKYEEVIGKRLLRAAKSYVPRFRVLEQGVTGSRSMYQVRIEATVAVAELYKELGRLGVGVRLGATVPGAASVRPTIALLMRARAGDGAWAVGLAMALETALKARGFSVVTAGGPAVGAAETATADAQPSSDASVLDDAHVAALARGAGATCALVVGTELAGEARIRGTRLVGTEASADVRLTEVGAAGLRDVEVSKRTFHTSGYGAGQTAAVESAVASLVQNLVRVLGVALEQRWPEPVAADDSAIVVRVRGVERWTDVDEILVALRKTPGVADALVRRFASHQVELAVATRLKAAQMMRAIQNATFASASAPVVQVLEDGVVLVDRPPDALDEPGL